MFNKIGLITNSGVTAVKSTLQELFDYLESRDKQIILNPCCAELISTNNHEVVDGEELGKHCDLVIAIGGDGTMLMASHLLCDFDVPLLGVNLGHVGFLADIPADDIERNMDEILNGHYVEDVRFLLRGQVFREQKCVYEGYAFNDVIIQKWNIAKLIELETHVNGTLVHNQRADGMIVSTPTGSTAYALSGGGPILHPSLDALVLVPICPHSLSNRPIVIDGNSVVDLVVGTPEIDHARLSCDGEIVLELMAADRVQIRKKDRMVRLIHPAHHNHFNTLRNKLRWG